RSVTQGILGRTERASSRTVATTPFTPGALPMPSDAKFGLAVGVTLVIAVAVLFYRREPTAAAPPPPAPAATATPLPAVPVAKPPAPPNGRPAVAQPLSHAREREGDR